MHIPRRSPLAGEQAPRNAQVRPQARFKGSDPLKQVHASVPVKGAAGQPRSTREHGEKAAPYWKPPSRIGKDADKTDGAKVESSHDRYAVTGHSALRPLRSDPANTGHSTTRKNMLARHAGFPGSKTNFSAFPKIFRLFRVK